MSMNSAAIKVRPRTRLLIAFALLTLAFTMLAYSAWRYYDAARLQTQFDDILSVIDEKTRSITAKDRLYLANNLDTDLEQLEHDYGVRLRANLPRADYPPDWLYEDGQLEMGSEIVATGHGVTFARCLRLVKPEIERYPSALIRQHLTNIHCFDLIILGGARAGGTYNLAQNNLYLKIKDTPALSIKQTFHHEFSSLLMHRHGFNEGTWRQAAGLAFRYQQDDDPWFQWMFLRDHIDDKPLPQELFARGLLRHYAETGVENDFNTYAQIIFTEPRRMKTLIDIYPVIARKYQLFKDFYLGIDAGLAPVFDAIEG